MKLFITNNKLFLLLLFIFIIAECIVNPIGNFPLNDDWSYGKPGLLFYKTGKINIGTFPAMTLFTHIVWGGIFTKLFGFSFTVLRFSTLISAVISAFFLNKLVVKITNNKTTAFIVCLCLLFNPIYFNLVNTYMTDVSFNTLIIMCCYYAYDFFNEKKALSFSLFFVCSALLVLLRQFGIIIPLCFVFACLLLKHEKWKYSILALIMSGLVFFIFKYYENFLKHVLEGGAVYKFSGGLGITEKVFWEKFLINLEQRITTVLLHILFYTFPFILLFFSGLLKRSKIITIALVSFLGVLVVYYGFNAERFPIGNIFSNTNVGAETFYETLQPQFQSLHEHTWSEQVDNIARWLKYGFISITIVTVTLMLLKLEKKKSGSFYHRPVFIFLLGFLFLYSFLLFVPDSYSDRYHLPLITVALIGLAFGNKRFSVKPVYAVIPLCFFFYISVAGTKDYLELNRTRWEAYHFLKDDMKVDYKKINGGFEVNCWNEGENSIWYEFLDLKAYDFLIQYRQEAGFMILKEYEFQRYFPYKKDKIYIFVNEHSLK